MTPQEGLKRKNGCCGRGGSFRCKHGTQPIHEIHAQHKRREICQMPGRGIIETKIFQGMHWSSRKQQVSRSPVLVVVPAGPVGLFEIEATAKPLGRRVGVAQGIRILVEQRLIPG